MSLILDALRKADAERERGSVPSLHSHPVVPLAAEAPANPRARAAWLWPAIGGLVVLAGVAAWVLVGRAPMPSANAPAVAAAPSGAPSNSVASPPVAAVPAPAPAAAPAAAAPDASIAATPTPATAAPAGTGPVAEPAPWPQPEERKALRPEPKGEAPVPVLGNVPPAPPPVHTRESLPADIRAQLPQFTIGGSIYSPNPAGRSLIVNGQLFREKDRLTQDLSLDEIKLKAAVFSFRGYRFEVLF